MKYQIQQMLEQGGGALVNNSSIFGLVGRSNSSIYSTSKHSILGLTRSASLEYANSGIRINAVCLGDIKTNTIERMVNSEKAMTQYAASTTYN